MQSLFALWLRSIRLLFRFVFCYLYTQDWHRAKPANVFQGSSRLDFEPGKTVGNSVTIIYYYIPFTILFLLWSHPTLFGFLVAMFYYQDDIYWFKSVSFVACQTLYCLLLYWLLFTSGGSSIWIGGLTPPSLCFKPVSGVQARKPINEHYNPSIKSCVAHPLFYTNRHCCWLWRYTLLQLFYRLSWRTVAVVIYEMWILMFFF